MSMFYRKDENLDGVPATAGTGYIYEEVKDAKYYFKKILFSWVIPITIEILVIFLLVKYVFFFARVPTGSMVPTIMENSLLLVTRVHNPEKSIKRGDIVVFFSEEENLNMCKRVVGLPGDKVKIKPDGTLLVNGWELHEPYVVNQYNYDRYYVNNYEFDVPEDHYIFMGDNRANSEDSRFWKQPYIHKDNILGEVKFTLFPLNKFGILK